MDTCITSVVTMVHLYCLPAGSRPEMWFVTTDQVIWRWSGINYTSWQKDGLLIGMSVCTRCFRLLVEQ